MIALALFVGACTLGVALGLALVIRRLPSVRLQLVALALVAVVLPLGAVTATGSVMFHMGSDRVILAVSAASATAAIIGALVVGRGITQRLETAQRAADQVSAGDLNVRIDSGGPSELASLAMAFNVMTHHLKRTEESRRQMVAWASHDLRAPITSLQATLEAAEDGVIDLDDYLTGLQGQVRFLSAMVDDLSELSAVESGRVTISPSDMALLPVLRELSDRFAASARNEHVRILLDVRGEIVVTCDPRKLERVLANLITNAISYTDAGGSVTIGAKHGGGAALISVEDTGVGIAPEAAELVFEPFWRADPSRSPGSGIGLGLAISKALIEAQHGEIWVERPPNGGTRLCVLLPLARDVSTEPLDGARPPRMP